jgi:nucleoside-diphosphate-sugar epimerase
MESLHGKRLVILGCGYVGTAVAREALKAGLRVEALTRNSGRAAELAALGAHPVVADLAADTWHGRLAPGADLVLNCVSSGGGGLEGYRRSYVEGMRSLLAWAQRDPAGTLVYTSSTSVYPQDGGGVVDEEAPTEGAGETGRILLEAEELLRRGSGACGRWFILRLAGIYGPERHHLLEQVRTGAAEIAGSGTQHLNLAHRDDICAAVLAAFAAPASLSGGIFNESRGSAVAGGAARPAGAAFHRRRGQCATWIRGASGSAHQQRQTQGDAWLETAVPLVSRGLCGDIKCLKNARAWEPLAFFRSEP